MQRHDTQHPKMLSYIIRSSHISSNSSTFKFEGCRLRDAQPMGLSYVTLLSVLLSSTCDCHQSLDFQSRLDTSSITCVQHRAFANVPKYCEIARNVLLFTGFYPDFTFRQTFNTFRSQKTLNKHKIVQNPFRDPHTHLYAYMRIQSHPLVPIVMVATTL